MALRFHLAVLTGIALGLGGSDFCLATRQCVRLLAGGAGLGCPLHANEAWSCTGSERTHCRWPHTLDKITGC